MSSSTFVLLPFPLGGCTMTAGMLFGILVLWLTTFRNWNNFQELEHVEEDKANVFDSRELCLRSLFTVIYV